MFYSIGYSLTSISNFITALKERDVSTLVDVRTTPFSRNKPFSKGPLKKALEHNGIQYIHEERLGGQSGQRSPEYQEGLANLISVNSIKAGNVAFMCLERDPMKCHRGGWITPDLIAKGEEVEHILPTMKGDEREGHHLGEFS